MKESSEYLRNLAEELETWADECHNGGWSTNLVKRLRDKAIKLRSKAREIESIEGDWV